MLKRFSAGWLLGTVVVLLGCADAGSRPTQPEAISEVPSALLNQSEATPTAAHNRSFVAALRGAAEVPPAPSTAVGMAGFQIRPGGTSISFLVLIGRLNNLNQAHIHLAPAGQNGPVVAWLYPSGPPPVPIPGEFNGVLSEGVITAANLVGPLAGQPLSALIQEMRAGNTYVNVHSAQFPGGEIRGQITRVASLD